MCDFDGNIDNIYVRSDLYQESIFIILHHQYRMDNYKHSNIKNLIKYEQLSYIIY